MKESIYVILSFMLTGCGQGYILHNEPIENVIEMAQWQDKQFCCVLTEGKSQLSPTNLTENTIVNLCDIRQPENHWYIKWLDLPKLPVLCSFTNNGELVDIEYIATGEHESACRIDLFDRILKFRRYVILGSDISEDIENTSVLKNYPYLYYLKLLCKIISNDTLGVEQAAYSLLDFKFLDKYSELYKNEFMIAETFIGNNHNGPQISLSDDIVRLTCTRKGQKKKIGINIHNTGNEYMLINHVSTGCSCVIPLFDNRPISIGPKESLLLEFEVIIETPGMYREITIISDAINAPVSRIKIITK